MLADGLGKALHYMWHELEGERSAGALCNFWMQSSNLRT